MASVSLIFLVLSFTHGSWREVQSARVAMNSGALSSLTRVARNESMVTHSLTDKVEESALEDRANDEQSVPDLELPWRQVRKGQSIAIVTKSRVPAGVIREGVKFVIQDHIGRSNLLKIAIPGGSINHKVCTAGLGCDQLEKNNFWTDAWITSLTKKTYIGYVAETESNFQKALTGESQAFSGSTWSKQVACEESVIAEIGNTKPYVNKKGIASYAYAEVAPLLLQFGAGNGACAVTPLPEYRGQDQLFAMQKTLQLLPNSYFGKKNESQGDPYLIHVVHVSGSPEVSGRYSESFDSWSIPSVFRNAKEDEDGPTPYSSHALQVMYSAIGSERNACGQLPRVFSYFTIANEGMREVLEKSFGGDSVKACLRADPNPIAAVAALSNQPECTQPKMSVCNPKSSDIFCMMYLNNPLGSLAGKALSAIFGDEGGDNWEVVAVTRWMLGESNEVSFTIRDNRCNHQRKFSCETAKYTDCAA